MSRLIAVRPEAEAWSVRIDQQDGVLLFRSGAEAESVARRLAGRLAQFGEQVEVLIFLRDGSLGGRLRPRRRNSPPPHEPSGRGAASEPSSA